MCHHQGPTSFDENTSRRATTALLMRRLRHNRLIPQPSRRRLLFRFCCEQLPLLRAYCCPCSSFGLMRWTHMKITERTEVNIFTARTKRRLVSNERFKLCFSAQARHKSGGSLFALCSNQFWLPPSDAAFAVVFPCISGFREIIECRSTRFPSPPQHAEHRRLCAADIFLS